MKNKTNRKIKKRRTLKTKKNFGGMKKNENGLDGKAWETPQGYNCVSCMDQKTRNASMKTMCSNGHGICIKCVKDFCKGRARPEWREQGPNRVKCPLCGEDITDRCMEITGKNTLEKMAEMHNVPTFAELHAPPPPPSPAPSIESPIHYPTFGAPSPLHDGGPMVVEELANSPMAVEEDEEDEYLIEHLSESEIERLQSIIVLMIESIRYGIRETLIQDIQGTGDIARRPDAILADIQHHFQPNGRPNLLEQNHTYDLYSLNSKYIQGVSSTRDYMQELRLLSRDIKTRLVDLVDINDELLYGTVPQNMLSYIFNSTIIGASDIQSHFFIDLFSYLAGQGLVNPGDWADISNILYQIASILRFELRSVVYHIFVNYEVNHGGKKRRKRRNTKKKRRGGGNELSQESINKDLKDMRTSLQQTFVPTGPREHRSKSNLDAITLGNFKIQDKEAKRVSKKKTKRKK